MNKMIKFFALGALATTLSFTQVNAQAQTGKDVKTKTERVKKTPEEMMQNMVDKMGERLNLTDKQKTQISELKAKQMKERQALSDQQKQLKTQYKSDFEKILTAEQLEQLKEMRAERAEKMKSQKGKYQNYRGQSPHSNWRNGGGCSDWKGGEKGSWNKQPADK